MPRRSGCATVVRVRIVGGNLGGRVLRAPAGAATRPTSEKVREAVFNILGPVVDARGLGALSRGAAHVTFVDSARAAVVAIRSNLHALGIADKATVIAGDAVAAARQAPPAPWQLVF